jgi:ABC-type multidrug transport system permease subunit
MGISANNCVPNIVNGRSVFYREQAAGAYHPFTFLLALITTELPITLLTSAILSTLVYWIAGLTATASQFFFFAWIMFIFGTLNMAYVVLLSLASPNGEVAQALVGMFIF